jgi:hypothetical protein
MALTYRSVKGSQLTSAEGDVNISTLHGYDSHTQKTVQVNTLFTGVDTITPTQIAAWANARPAAIEVLETHGVVWFFAVLSLNGRLYKYTFSFNGGRGNWGATGAGGTVVTAGMFVLFMVGPAIISDIQGEGVPQYVDDVVLSGGQTVSEWLNVQSPGVVIQAQSAGLTFFEDEEAGLTWLWVGEPGTYGLGQLQSTNADFQEIAATPVEAIVPGLDQVLQAGNVSNRDIYLTNEGALVVSNDEGYAVINWIDIFNIYSTSDYFQFNGKNMVRSVNEREANPAGDVDMFPEYETIQDVPLPGPKGFVKVNSDATMFGANQVLLCFNDGTAETPGQLFGLVMDKMTTFNPNL